MLIYLRNKEKKEKSSFGFKTVTIMSLSSDYELKCAFWIILLLINNQTKYFY